VTAPFNRAGLRPLLPAGIHPSDWSGLQRFCVDYFPNSTMRPRLMSTISMIARLVNEASMPARLWIGGDFLTEKENPSDCSVAIVPVESGSQVSACPTRFLDRSIGSSDARIEWLELLIRVPV
jgi:hypothetical protein